MTYIIGSGGSKGGGGGDKPHEAKDNLDSKQFAKVLDVISEGEISGLVDGAKSIFLNNTPLQSTDGTYNFKDVSWETRTGTSSQTVIPITENTSTVKSTGLGTIQHGSPGVVQITDSTVDAVKVTISIPALQRMTDEGDIYGTDVELAIAVQYHGGSYSNVVELQDGKIGGRTGDLYQRDYLISLSGTFPVNIRVTRVTEDSDSSKLTNAFSWTSYTEITYDSRPYNNTALVGLRLDAEQFTNIPTRKYLIKGIKVKVPHNASVRADGSLSYSGVFNGTLGAAVWTNDPAWCLYDLLTSSRYGLGDHLDADRLDKFAFYTASKYCSEQVDDGTGTGGTEPRFSCNMNIQRPRDAYSTINQMCSIFRAMPFWSAGNMTVAQDAPADPSYMFTMANVLEPGFTYQNASQKTRSTVAIVKYLDLELRDINYEEVTDTANQARYGTVVKNIDAFACTSRGQAHRLGKWLLYMENVERETVSFIASLEAGVIVRPGQIIEIADPVKSGERRGGKIKSATTTSVTVDDIGDITYTPSTTITVVLPDGTVETKSISGISSGGVINNATAAFSAAPLPNSIWIYQTASIKTSTWRVLGIEEQDGTNYAISAIQYNSTKYEFIENNIALTERDITDLNVPPEAPSGLVGTEIMYENTGIARVKIQLSWTSSTDNVRVRWRYESGNWESRTVEGSKGFDILDTVQGNYKIEVYSLSASGLSSASPATLDPFVAQGKTALPSQVTGVSLLPIDEASAILSWDRSTELDVLLGGRTLIRHSELTSNATWANSQEIVVAATGSQTQKQVPLLTGTYLLRFMDDGGRQSAEPSTTNDLDKTRVEIDLPAPTERLLVQTVDEHTGNFAGTKTDTVYDSGNDALQLGEVSSGVVKASGEYAFNTVVDLTQPYDVNIKRNIRSASFYLGTNWDSRTGFIDDWGTIDNVGGAVADQCNATLYLRATNDDPASGSAPWGTWREFSNVLVKGRGFQFKALLTSADTNQNISITQLGATLELQGRTESIATPVTTGSSQYTVTFTNAFKNTPTVVISPTNQQSGDFYELANISRTGFQVTFKNGSSAVARSFVWAASGFGKERT